VRRFRARTVESLLFALGVLLGLAGILALVVVVAAFYLI